MGKDEWVSREEAAQQLKVSKTMLRLLETEGKIQAGRTPGGTRRISLRSIQNYLESQRRQGR